MSTAIIPGTRPEIIKMSPMIRELDHKRQDIVFSSGFNNHRELRGHREKQHRSVISVYSVVDQLHSNSFFQNKFENNKPQIIAPRVTPLEGVSTSTVAPVDVAHTYGSPPYVDIAARYALRGMRVRGVENPQGLGIDGRRLIALFHGKKHTAHSHKSLNSEEIIRTGTRISRINRNLSLRGIGHALHALLLIIGRIYTDPCPSIFSPPGLARTAAVLEQNWHQVEI